MKLGPGALRRAITRLAERGLIEPLGTDDGRRRLAPGSPAGFGRAGRGAGGHARVARAGLLRLGLDPA